jgi:hypothetical protein
LNEIVLLAAERTDLAERLLRFYEAADQAIAERGPVCRNRGLCCHFAAFGHKLYVSTVELAYFVRHARGQWRAPNGADDCPYHVAGRCEARAFRPLGCRVFFCDSETREWQGPEYEGRLIELRRIGEEFGVEYRYLEWLSALTELSDAVASKHPQGSQD